MWTLVDLSAAVGLLLYWFHSLGVWGFLLHLHHGGAGLGGRREAAYARERRRSIWVQALRLQLGLCQEHLPSLHLLLKLFIIRLKRKKFNLLKAKMSNCSILHIINHEMFSEFFRPVSTKARIQGMGEKMKGGKN